MKNIYAICAFAAIGGGLFGFDISSMSGVLGTRAYTNYFNNPRGARVSLYPLNYWLDIGGLTFSYSKELSPPQCQLVHSLVLLYLPLSEITWAVKRQSRLDAFSGFSDQCKIASRE